jgi:hypothetical protein
MRQNNGFSMLRFGLCRLTALTMLVSSLSGCGSSTSTSSSHEGGKSSTDAAPQGGSEGIDSTSEPNPRGGNSAPNIPNSDGKWADLGDVAAPTHDTPSPVNQSSVTLGGTMTFKNIGATGYWGRRIEAQPGDPRCDVQSETINYSWGGSEFCCRTKHVVTNDRITPFNEQLTMVLDGPMRVKQLAIYQPQGDVSAPWAIRSYWDKRTYDKAFNFHFVGPNKQTTFAGDLGNNCSFFAMQERKFPCGPGSNPYCPGSDLDYYGWAGSKLFVLLASMPYADDPSFDVPTCIKPEQNERAEDSPWIGVAPSELNRDGWSGYHPCHCFANKDAGIGDGCGQINVFEVVAESSGEKWGNRDVISTGIRSYQVGSLGGVTCGIQGCGIDQFAKNADLLDANSLKAMTKGAQIDAEQPEMAEGPIWRRSTDDRYYVFLLDENTRTVQVMLFHPGNLPETLRPILPELPNVISRSVIDSLVTLTVP